MLKRKGKVLVASNIVAGVMLSSSQSVLAGPGASFLQKYCCCIYYTIKKCCTECFGDDDSSNKLSHNGIDFEELDYESNFCSRRRTVIGKDNNKTYEKIKSDSDEEINAGEEKVDKTIDLSEVREKYFSGYGKKGEIAFKLFIKEAKDKGYIIKESDKNVPGFVRSLDLDTILKYLFSKNRSDNYYSNSGALIKSLSFKWTEKSKKLLREHVEHLRNQSSQSNRTNLPPIELQDFNYS